jgi:dethiobiotin synthetase/malonyl-CoA O-methyltransferase
MLRGLFVTGTGTDVGKTVVSAAIMHRYRSLAPLRYWKPIQTGIERDDDTEMVRILGDCDTQELFCDGIRLAGPVSPHLAAELAQTSIQIPELTSRIDNEPVSVRWVVEGAGGVLVPLNEHEMMVDLVIKLQLPVLVVAHSGLGTINHTLLTLEALRTRALEVAGVVMVGERNSSNREAIESRGNIRVLGELPHIPALAKDELKEWANSELDLTGLLWPHLK